LEVFVKNVNIVSMKTCVRMEEAITITLFF